jgi:GNAT superfamily N-acetyltransferase
MATAIATPVSVLEPARADEAAALLARSLIDDPGWAHVFPERGRRELGLQVACTVAARDAAALGGARTLEAADGSLQGVAIWLPPGAFPRDARRKLRALPALLSVLARAPGSFGRFTRLGTELEAMFPSDPVWYLEILGVRPEGQGSGVGSLLVRDGLARADADGLPAYLETARPQNVAFYERFGFRVERQVRVLDDGPPFWMMRRPPGGP